MTQTQVTQIKQNTLKIPAKLKKYWQGKDVYIRFSPESIYIKKLEPQSFWQIRDDLKEVSKTISQKDIDQAVAWARNKAR